MEKLFVEFPPAIIKASELLVTGSGVKYAYPVNMSFNPVVAPSNTSVLCAITHAENVTLIGIYYKSRILNNTGFVRLPSAVDLEINTNPLTNIADIGSGVFTSVGGSSLVNNFIRLSLPPEQSLIDLQNYPFTIISGTEFRPTVTIYDPGFVITDTVNLQFTFVFTAKK